MLVLTILLFTGCPSKDCYGVRDTDEHVLQINLSVEPVKEAYRVGDTLNVVVSFPEEIIDTVTRQNFRIPDSYGFLLNSLVSIADSITSNSSVYRIDSIVTLLSQQELEEVYGAYIFRGSSGTNMLSQFAYDEDRAAYSVAYSFTLDEPGIYVLENSTNIGDQDLFGELEIDGLCENADLTSTVTIDESIPVRIDLLEGTRVNRFISVLTSRSQNRFDEYGPYVFKVE